MQAAGAKQSSNKSLTKEIDKRATTTLRTYTYTPREFKKSNCLSKRTGRSLSAS